MNLIIDVSNYLNRVYFGYTRALAENTTGEVVNFYDFALFSLKKAKEEGYTNVYTVWDTKLLEGAKSFRTEMLGEDYKAGRDKSHYEEMQKFMSGLAEFFTAMGFRNMYPYTLEADDVIAWLAKNLDGKTRIFSADTDMYQLINNNVSVYSPNKKKDITIKNFYDEVGVAQSEYVLYKVIKGDTSDNIEGLKGYGPVKAAKLAREMIAKPELLKEHKEATLLKRNFKLISLSYSLSASPKDTESFKEQFYKTLNIQPDYSEFTKLCDKYKAFKIKRSSYYWNDIFPKTNAIVKEEKNELDDDMPDVEEGI